MAKTKTISGTKEWAAHNVNCKRGCSHDCWYCYARCMAVRFGRTSPEAWRREEVNTTAVEKGYRKRSGRIMFPTSHDITPSNLKPSLIVIRKLLAAGNELLVVTKPHLTCVRALCLDLKEYRGLMTFRFTIGSTSDKVLRLWEPGAPLFNERLASLQLAHSQRFATSVSCEPMLDGRVEDVIAAVEPYVTDTIWIGKANRLMSILAVNKAPAKVLAAAERLLAVQTDDDIQALYRRLKDRPQIRWKEGIKDVVGLERLTEKGLDR